MVNERCYKLLIHSRVYLYERTARYKFISQVDFSSRLEVTCNDTNGVRKFRRWRQYRPTWPHSEGPSRLKSTYSTRLAGLVSRVKHPLLIIEGP